MVSVKTISIARRINKAFCGGYRTGQFEWLGMVLEAGIDCYVACGLGFPDYFDAPLPTNHDIRFSDVDRTNLCNRC